MKLRTIIKHFLLKINPVYAAANKNAIEINNLKQSNKWLIKQCAEIIANVDFIGQELQDMYAYLYFKGKQDGFFVDIGALDGLIISNTYALERIGWKGICVEPNIITYQKLIKNRKCDCVNAAIYNEENELEFIKTNWGLSGFKKNMSKEMIKRAETEGVIEVLSMKPITFTKLMEKYDIEYIDFLSIDVEGSELEVLASIDFNKYKFGLITIEHNNVQLQDFMFSRGYKLFLDLGVDLFFIPKNIEIGRYWWADP